MKGRDRKSFRDRYPGGRIKVEPMGYPPTLVRRMIDTAAKDASNPLLGSALGQLRLAGVITDIACSAGMRFCELVATYDRLKGLPPRHAKGASYQAGLGTSLRAPPTDAEVQRVESRYLSALEAMDGHRELVLGLCVYDRAPIGERETYFTRVGLEMLAVHFGLVKC